MAPDSQAGMVIVGAGHAGGRAAQALREAGWRGPISLVGEEPATPYERPPLSKGLLTGDRTAESCALHAPGYYDGEGIALHLSTQVRVIDREHRSVVLADGSSLPYHRLLLAPGAVPRTLPVPGAELAGVHTLRDLADVRRLLPVLGADRRLVVVGGGFIGLEVAASARQQGCAVTVFEVAPRLMNRVVPPEIAERVAARHRAAGVEIRCAARIDRLLGDGQVAAVRLDDGMEIPCDAVLVGIGVAPRVELAEAAGLAIDNGIAVDERLRTTDPFVFAVGDAVSFPHPLYGCRIRLESWKNAEDQAAVAARNMLGAEETYQTVPWFWSDQYDLTLQIAGLPDLASYGVSREVAGDTVLFFHLDDDGRLVGASGIGPGTSVGRDIRLAQLLIERRLCPDPERLRDPAVKLKSLLS